MKKSLLIATILSVGFTANANAREEFYNVRRAANPDVMVNLGALDALVQKPAPAKASKKKSKKASATQAETVTLTPEAPMQVAGTRTITRDEQPRPRQLTIAQPPSPVQNYENTNLGQTIYQQQPAYQTSGQPAYQQPQYQPPVFQPTQPNAISIPQIPTSSVNAQTPPGTLPMPSMPSIARPSDDFIADTSVSVRSKKAVPAPSPAPVMAPPPAPVAMPSIPTPPPAPAAPIAAPSIPIPPKPAVVTPPVAAPAIPLPPKPPSVPAPAPVASAPKLPATPSFAPPPPVPVSSDFAPLKPTTTTVTKKAEVKAPPVIPTPPAPQKLNTLPPMPTAVKAPEKKEDSIKIPPAPPAASIQKPVSASPMVIKPALPPLPAASATTPKAPSLPPIPAAAPTVQPAAKLPALPASPAAAALPPLPLPPAPPAPPGAPVAKDNLGAPVTQLEIPPMPKPNPANAPQLPTPAYKEATKPSVAAVANTAPELPTVAPAANADATLIYGEAETDLPISEQAKLQALANQLTADKSLVLNIVSFASGSADQAGQATRTSLARGLNVRRFFLDRNINRERINVRPLGNKATGGVPDRVDIFLDKATKG